LLSSSDHNTRRPWRVGQLDAIITVMRFRKRRSAYDEVHIGLSRDEALVLDALFARHRDEDQPLEPIDDAERSALIGLGAALEGAVFNEVSDDGYGGFLAEARRRLAKDAWPKDDQ
jgi:hypothetical protein